MALSDYEAVREVIQQYIHGSGNGDAQALRDIFFPEAVMSGDYQGKLSFGTPDSFFELIENSPALAESGTNYKSVISSIEVVVVDVLLVRCFRRRSPRRVRGGHFGGGPRNL